MLLFVSKSYRAVASMLCLAAVVGTQIVASPPLVKWRVLLSTQSRTECSFCRVDCKSSSQTATRTIAADAGNHCLAQQQPTGNESRRDDSQPDPARGRDCPVCQHVLMSGRVLLSPTVELTNICAVPDSRSVESSEPIFVAWTGIRPPVRGPPQFRLLYSGMSATAIRDQNSIQSASILSGWHEGDFVFYARSLPAAHITTPGLSGTLLFLINHSRPGEHVHVSENFQTASAYRPQGSGTC